MAIDGADIQGDELPPGSVLCGGQYSIERYLNAGGFGVTYLARDSLGRRVVIKECFPSALCFRSQKTVRVRSQTSTVEFETILELFEKEARALAGLQHPYIVGVHQYFRDNDTAYMAMDFVEGQTLLDIIERDPARLTPDMVKALLIQLLQAVSFIHRSDILHRDISPDNILIDDDNLPVLIDFGAAREDASRVSRALSKVLTVKDGYSPQEFYLAGSDQVYASDLYALAATFHHVLSGTAPTSSHSRMAAAAREAPDPLKPLGRIDGYDAAFVGAINACLSLFPKDRLQTADAWHEAINAELRKKKLMQLAEQDEHLDKTITQLVKDFFKDFQPVKPEAKGAATPKAKAPEATRARVVPAPALDPIEPELDEDPIKTPASQDDGPVVPVRPNRPARPRRKAAADAEPALLPIDRIRLKYAKPAPPEETAVEKPKGTILPDLFARLGRMSSLASKPDGSHDPTEEKV
ncbi:serine/threonine protein kinase [Rhodobacteraceae bacterium N5(2021)]|uniref:non-specific serine/threonine protein kinase n=1 Tax=Gymnodinialimonas phycosphaerae TaxID=2841589 RepID=A0A975TW03_9RHOB|nr:serine/threonine-protein kinase [Gymnodinialimonas phycosphaerae]MBY4891974.1 serine/threonine protein kinase [Gymnodinialimonas phycosphaerae]